MTEQYDCVWPRAPRVAQHRTLAARPDSLAGATVAFVWDDLFRGDEIFPMLERELSARFPAMRFVGYQTFGSTHGDDEHRVLAALPALLREHRVDAVISGMGC